MCVLVAKNDKDGKPLSTKSRIVVLGDFEDRLYQKYERYALVLKYSSLRLLTAKAVGDKRILQQGDCKNVFCNATLPYDEVTVIGISERREGSGGKALRPILSIIPLTILYQ